MGFLYDTLRGWLSPSVDGRLAGRAALAGRMLESEPVRVGHPELQPIEAQIWHYPKVRRSVAATLTVGLAEATGRELVAFTLGDSRSPEAEPMARVLAAAVEGRIGDVLALPEGTLGRSAHRFVLVAGRPTPLDPERLGDWEKLLGGAIVTVLTVTEAERAFIAAHGHEVYLERMRAQGVAPCCDRRPGDVDLTGR